MKTLLSILTLLLSLNVIAQEYEFKHYDVESGLSNNKINSVYKDSKGFLWIGTASGLNRFDGNRFKVYRSTKDDYNTVPDNYIGSIQEDRNGDLYIKCGETYAVYIRHSDRFERDVALHIGMPDKDVAAQLVYIDKAKHIWIYDSSHGLYYKGAGDGDAVNVTKDTGLLSSGPTCMAEAANKLMLVCGDGNIYSVDISKNEVKHQSAVPFHDVNEFVEYSCYSDGRFLWVYGVNGMWRLNLNTREWKGRANDNERFHVVNCMTVDNKGVVWLGHDHYGVSLFDRDDNRLAMSDGERLANNTISSLYTDDDGSVWVGTYKKGLYQYNENMFKFKLNSFPDVNCISGTIYDANIAWIGTDAGDLIRWNYVTNESTRFCRSSNSIVCLLVNKPDDVWMGTYLGGLRHFADGKISAYHRTDGLASENVWALCDAPDGRIWIGTLGGGIQLFNPANGSFENYNMSNSNIPSNIVNSMIISRNGNLYIGTKYGVSVFNHATKKFTNKLGSHDGADCFANPAVTQLCEDCHGLLWIATIEGLYVYDDNTDKIYNVDVRRGQNPFILGIAEDNVGNLWVTEGAELIKVVTARDKVNKQLSFECCVYNRKDGLQNSDFNQRSFYLTPTGRMLVGGLYGINTFVPQYLKYNNTAPHVLFSDFLLFREPVEVGEKYNGRVVLAEELNSGGKVHLNYSQNYITIDFASDNYIIPENTTYYYRLLGFNNSWMVCDEGLSQATYTNLKPGEYTFEVKAVNNDGVESEEPSTLTIIVHTPFWMSAWAKLLYVALGLAVFVLILRYVRAREQDKFAKENVVEETGKAEKARKYAPALIDPSPSTIEITSMDEKLVNAAVKYVEDNISRADLTVEELSAGVGMSRVHFYKRLRQVTGKTPMDFIRVIRLKRAAQLLRESQMNVSEVAYQVGFNSPKYFSTHFREEYGVLPSVYQEKNKI